MFNIDFYNFIKDENSTKRPTGSPATYPCEIKRSSGLVSPTIELNIGLTTAPAWNYCYIADFNRYYFIDEWTFELGFWTASLSCDALATYRTEIGNADLYALRSSAVYDGRIIDNLYPTKVIPTNAYSEATPTWTNYEGVYVIGVVTNSTSNHQFGSMVYYVLSPVEFVHLNSYLLSDDFITDFNVNITDMTDEAIKSIIDPMQYIKSCVYIPILSGLVFNRVTDTDSLKIFSWDIGNYVSQLSSVHILNIARPSMETFDVLDIPKHPQTASRGQYVNQRPYTQMNVLAPPFGLIEVDTSIVCNFEKLNLLYTIDFPTGLGILTIKTGLTSQSGGVLLNRIEGQIGVPVQLSQVTRDYIGGISSIGGVLGNVISGGISGAITSIGNAVDSLTPKAQSIGSGGAYAQLQDVARLEAQFFEIVDDDIAKNGRPCCKIVNCKNAPGYYLIQDGDIAMGGTHSEAQIVKGYLESGFYWE